MKKFTVCAALVAAGMVAGYSICMGINNVAFLQEANDFKYELIDAQAKAIDLADSVMDNNQLFDADGSDTMADYLHAAAKVDSLYKTQE